MEDLPLLLPVEGLFCFSDWDTSGRAFGPGLVSESSSSKSTGLILCVVLTRFFLSTRVGLELVGDWLVAAGVWILRSSQSGIAPVSSQAV